MARQQLHSTQPGKEKNPKREPTALGSTTPL